MAIIVEGDMYEKLDGQLFEIKRQIRQKGGYPHDPELLSQGLQRLVKGEFEYSQKPPVEKQKTVVSEVPKQTILATDHATIHNWLDFWPIFCLEFKIPFEPGFFEAMKDLVKVRPADFDWCVYRPQGFTSRQAIDLCKSQFLVCEEIPVEEYSLERESDKPRLILCRATVEPDRDWRKSGNILRAETVPFMDCLERYLLEVYYFWLTKKLNGSGKHLDIKGWTRMPRSRARQDFMAYAGWVGDSGRFRASCNDGDYDNTHGGGREVVILESEPLST